MNRTLGSLVAILALLLGNGLTPGATAADSLPTGPEVVDRYIEAIGGRAAVAEIQSFHVTGSYVHSSLGNKAGTIDLIFMRPAQLIFTVEMPGSVRIQRGLVDGKAWQILPGQGASPVIGDGIKGFQKWALRGFSLLPGAKELQAATTVERTDFNGRPCYRVKMSVTPSGDEYHDYYDVETGLFAGRDDFFHGPTGAVAVHGKASDYKRFGKLTIPTKWTHEAAGQEWSAIYTSFETNSVADSAFLLPAELMAKGDK